MCPMLTSSVPIKDEDDEEAEEEAAGVEVVHDVQQLVLVCVLRPLALM
jgi:hypothetical protein